MASPKLEALVGQTIGRWAIMEVVLGKWRMLRCRCTCGIEREVAYTSLVQKKTRSCGCLNAELVGERSRTHGRSTSPIFKIWSQMLQRCTNPKAAYYHRYGGRGIKVCERWLSFENFLADVGERPSKDRSLDRIDNDGNYEPSNVRWATSEEQGMNRTTNHLLTHDGKTQPILAWARELGITSQSIRGRLRRGWSLAAALTTQKGG